MHQAYQSVGYGTSGCSHTLVFEQSRTRYQGSLPRAYLSDTGMDVVPGLPKCLVRYGWYYPHSGILARPYPVPECFATDVPNLMLGTGMKVVPSVPKVYGTGNTRVVCNLAWRQTIPKRSGDAAAVYYGCLYLPVSIIDYG